MKRLFDGVRRYHLHTKDRYEKRFARLATGQSPLALFITCADSRVVPNLIASAEPGELFVLRNIANIVPPSDRSADPSVAAAVAYAVDVLEVKDIVVCGHSSCGGVKALLGEPPADPSLRSWLEHARPAVDSWRERGPQGGAFSEVDQLSQHSTLRQIESLRTYPAVARADDVKLHAWWFEIATATVFAYDGEAHRFVPALEQLARIA